VTQRGTHPEWANGPSGICPSCGKAIDDHSGPLDKLQHILGPKPEVPGGPESEMEDKTDG